VARNGCDGAGRMRGRRVETADAGHEAAAANAGHGAAAANAGRNGGGGERGTERRRTRGRRIAAGHALIRQ
jgi:hypothetical protein